MTAEFAMLVDTDAGVDDALALFVLAQVARAATIDVAVTFGNVPLDQAMSNVSLISSLSGLSSRRVFRGSAAPLVGEPRFATDVHGHDGLGGVTDLPLWRAPPPLPRENLFGATKLDHYERIVTLGPLTDIARLIPASSVSAPLVVMGGAFEVGGN